MSQCTTGQINKLCGIPYCGNVSKLFVIDGAVDPFSVKCAGIMLVAGCMGLGKVIAISHVRTRIMRNKQNYMAFRSMANCVTFFAIFSSIAVVSYAQLNSSTHANSASHVAAEMMNGNLTPSASKPGDTVEVRLKEDVRSNGEIIFKKGTTIAGVVRSVGRAERKGDWKSRYQSIGEIDWLVPAPQGRGVQGVSFALQSVIQINREPEYEQKNSSEGLNFVRTAVPNPSNPLNGRSNIALLSMPTVVAVDEQTSASIENTLGNEASGELFKVGHGQLASSSGSKESVELYSHLTNDTVITSPSNDFEMSSGAQMQMLVGVIRKDDGRHGLAAPKKR